MKFGLTAQSVLWGAVLLAGVVVLGPGCGKKKTVGPIKGDPTLVVVQINDQIITLAQVDRAVQQIRQQGARSGVNPDAPEDSLQAKAIEDLISQRLLYLEARKAGAIPTDQETADFIKGFLQQQRIPSEDSFLVALKGVGMTKEQFVLDWQMSTGINKFLRKAVQETVKVTPEQAQAYYDSHPEEFQRGEAAHARHIFLRIPEGATPEESASIKAKLETIATQIKRGADFGQMAQANSEDTQSGAQGGDLGFNPRGRLPGPIDSVAFTLAPGTVSGPVRTNFGWHLIKTEEIAPPGLVPFAEIRDRLVPGLTRKRVGTAIETWVAELKKKAKIKRKV